MAARSRLQEAIERARKLREGAVPAAPRAPSTAAERQSAVHSMRDFQTVPYSQTDCERNRILVPGSDKRVNPVGAAAYRMLRARLLQRMHSNKWTTIGVTSPGQGDGKSVTALNLALSIAREGNHNVFLVDLDMRNPKMCEYLGAAPRGEINDYLAGHVPPEAVLFSIGIENLTLAGTRTRTNQASELLASGRVEELFDYIRGIAVEPIVFVDLPPLLSTDDALVIAPKVDACLLVVAQGRSRRDGAARAIELLSEYQVAGVILNTSNTMVKDYYST